MRSSRSSSSSRLAEDDDVKVRRVRRSSGCGNNLWWAVVSGLTVLTIAAVVFSIFGLIGYIQTNDDDNTGTCNCTATLNASVIPLDSINPNLDLTNAQILSDTYGEVLDGTLDPATVTGFVYHIDSVPVATHLIGQSSETGEVTMTFGIVPPEDNTTLVKRSGNDDDDDDDDNNRRCSGLIVKANGRRGDCTKVGINVPSPQCSLDVRDTFCLKGNATITGNLNLINGSITVNGVPLTGGGGNGTGPAGPAGPVGPTGPVGPIGPAGATGASGPRGFNGTQGPQGFNGSIGATGPQGLIGPQGLTGPTGLTGPVGPIGPTGATGVIGLNYLNQETYEPAGSNCQYSGIKLEGGLDLNANGVLDISEVNQTGFICTGAPGAPGAPGAQGQPGVSASEICVNVTCPSTTKIDGCRIYTCVTGSPCTVTGIAPDCCSIDDDCDTFFPCFMGTCSGTQLLNNNMTVGKCVYAYAPNCTYDIDCPSTSYPQICQGCQCVPLPTQNTTNWCYTASDCSPVPSGTVAVCENDFTCSFMPIGGFCVADVDCNVEAIGGCTATGTCNVGNGQCSYVYADADGDGLDCSKDCDDNNNATSYPIVWHRDADNDTYGNPGSEVLGCTQPVGYVLDGSDCDDTNAMIHPSAKELCNGIDDDCNGQVDDGIVYFDQSTVLSSLPCPSYDLGSNNPLCVSARLFCSGGLPTCNYSAPMEICDGIDQNCDGSTDNFAYCPRVVNANGNCTGGACAYVCFTGYGNCSGPIESVGCDTSIFSDNNNCGGCGVFCNTSNFKMCIQGACVNLPTGPAGSQGPTGPTGPIGVTGPNWPVICTNETVLTPSFNASYLITTATFQDTIIDLQANCTFGTTVHFSHLNANLLANQVIQQNSGSRQWRSIASSSDGTRLASVAENDGIFTSSDSGLTWTRRTNDTLISWSAIASSSNGANLIAVSSSTGIATSSDYGVTWTYNPISGDFRSVTSSTDGTRLAMAENNGYIWSSSNSGATWTQTNTDSLRPWTGITSSSDGSKITAVESTGRIWTSFSAFNATLTEQMGSIVAQWQSVASSSDGTKLVAVVNGGRIWTSSDSGVTWIQRTIDQNRFWLSCASSSDGSRLIAVANIGRIWTSSDYGITWTLRTYDQNRFWQSCASSSDGKKLAAVVYNNQVWATTDLKNYGRETSVVCDCTGNWISREESHFNEVSISYASISTLVINNVTVTSASQLIGPTGPTGPQGPSGPQGATGPANVNLLNGNVTDSTLYGIINNTGTISGGLLTSTEITGTTVNGTKLDSWLVRTCIDDATTITQPGSYVYTGNATTFNLATPCNAKNTVNVKAQSVSLTPTFESIASMKTMPAAFKAMCNCNGANLIVAISSDSQTLYRSDNGGTTWTSVASNIAVNQPVSLACGDTSFIYVRTNQSPGIAYTSTPATTVSTILSSALPVSNVSPSLDAYVVTTREPSGLMIVIYTTVGNTHVYRSTDGVSWTTQLSVLSLPVQLKYAKCISSGFCYISGGVNGLYRFSAFASGGVSIDSSESSYLDVSQTAILSVSSSTNLRLDLGLGFFPVLGLPTVAWKTVVITFNSIFIATTTVGETYYSYDTGTTWTKGSQTNDLIIATGSSSLISASSTLLTTYSIQTLGTLPIGYTGTYTCDCSTFSWYEQKTIVPNGATLSNVILTGGTTNTGNTITGGIIAGSTLSVTTLAGGTTNTGNTITGGIISGSSLTSIPSIQLSGVISAHIKLLTTYLELTTLIGFNRFPTFYNFQFTRIGRCVMMVLPNEITNNGLTGSGIISSTTLIPTEFLSNLFPTVPIATVIPVVNAGTSQFGLVRILPSGVISFYPDAGPTGVFNAVGTFTIRPFSATWFTS